MEAACRYVYAALIKHNNLLVDSISFAKSIAQTVDGLPERTYKDIPPNLLFIWKIAQKMKNWLVIKHQDAKLISEDKPRFNS